MVASTARALWESGVAGGAAVALALAVWGSAKSLGLLDRPKHWLRCNYVRPHDVVGFPTVPHFVLEYENRGNVPVVFSDFFLLLPRLEGVLTTDGAFISHPGADLLIDKRPSARIGSAQAYRIMRISTRDERSKAQPRPSTGTPRHARTR